MCGAITGATAPTDMSGRAASRRSRSSPIQKDAHFLTVRRYVERNPVRARLVERAEDWRWSSLAEDGPAANVARQSPVRLPDDWADYVNTAQTAEELETLRNSVNRGAPFGGERWARRTVHRLGLDSTLRPRGRPRIQPE